MKKLVPLLCLLLLGNAAFAFEIVYPKKNEVTINANSTFFVGNSDTPLKINGQEVPIHQSGGFAYVVNLKEGKNTFTIQSDNDKQIFIITKPSIKTSCPEKKEFIQYPEKKFFYVVTEGAPLRSTPVDAGINRISHLQRNVNLIVDGEKDGFYRVILGDNKHGWIAKTNVKLFDTYNDYNANVFGYDYIDSPEYFTFLFYLNKQVPFEITEDEPMTLKFFNISDQVDNTYIYDFPFKMATEDKNLQGYSGIYRSTNFEWKIRKPQPINPKKPLKNIKIAIDAGHGGSEIGAIGCLGDKEKDINLSIAKNLESELKKRGAKVIMTRDDDIYVGLKDRVEKANQEDANILLSIHANALPDGADPNKNTGTSIYYYYNQAKPLAEKLLETITTEIGTNNDKVRQASLALVRNTNALSLLIEVGYLINPNDNSNLINTDFQKECAKAIADGLEKYYQENDN